MALGKSPCCQKSYEAWQNSRAESSISWLVFSGVCGMSDRGLLSRASGGGKGSSFSILTGLTIFCFSSILDRVATFCSSSGFSGMAIFSSFSFLDNGVRSFLPSFFAIADTSSSLFLGRDKRTAMFCSACFLGREETFCSSSISPEIPIFSSCLSPGRDAIFCSGVEGGGLEKGSSTTSLSESGYSNNRPRMNFHIPPSD